MPPLLVEQGSLKPSVTSCAEQVLWKCQLLGALTCQLGPGAPTPVHLDFSVHILFPNAAPGAPLQSSRSTPPLELGSSTCFSGNSCSPSCLAPVPSQLSPYRIHQTVVYIYLQPGANDFRLSKIYPSASSLDCELFEERSFSLIYLTISNLQKGSWQGALRGWMVRPWLSLQTGKCIRCLFTLMFNI